MTDDERSPASPRGVCCTPPAVRTCLRWIPVFRILFVLSQTPQKGSEMKDKLIQKMETANIQSTVLRKVLK